MTKTIARLWSGELMTSRCLEESDPALKDLTALIRRHRAKLEENLSGETKASFEKYWDCMDEYILIANRQAFCSGFCLGTRLTAEALSEDGAL